MMMMGGSPKSITDRPQSVLNAAARGHVPSAALRLALAGRSSAGELQVRSHCPSTGAYSAGLPSIL